MDLNNKVKKLENEVRNLNNKVKKIEEEVFALLNRHKPNTDNALTTLTMAIKKLQKEIRQLKTK